MNLIVYEYQGIPDPIAGFVDQLNERELRYSSFDLLQLGLETLDEVEAAVSKAMHTCNSAGMPLNENFKMVYVNIEGRMMKLWRLSKVAFGLSLINANPQNEKLANLQLALLKRWGQYF